MKYESSIRVFKINWQRKRSHGAEQDGSHGGQATRHHE